MHRLGSRSLSSFLSIIIMDHTLISVLDILYGGAADIFSHRGKNGILTVVAWDKTLF